MSKLDELIKELCPNGVEYKKLKDLCKIKTGKLNANEMEENGIYPFFTCDEKPYKINEYAFDDEAILISGNGSKVGHINYYKGKFNAYQRTYVLLNFNNGIVKYYVFYLKEFLKKHIIKNSNKASVPYITLPMLENYLVPVPPLEVQDEIVRILDSFIALTTKLTTELTARKKQYSWYRDYLLNFENRVEIVKLGSISNIVRGASPRPISNYITLEEDGINWIKIGDVDSESRYVEETKEKITQEGAKKSRIVKKGDLILSNSMSFGRPYIVNQEGCIHDGWILISDYQTNYSTDFLYYLLTTNKVQKYMRDNVVSGTVQNLNIDIVKNIEIPLPPLEVQKRIVEVLDNFEKICNNLNIGLPAEIEARQKQYEFYRNFLLTFNNEEIYTLSKQASKQASPKSN